MHRAAISEPLEVHHLQRLAPRLLLLGLLLLGRGAFAAELTYADAAPSPSLAPQEVVRIQLESLRQNDSQDAGIEVAFRFASPSNKRQTGPLPRFAKMIQAGPYALMLNWRDVDFDAEDVRDDTARQVVTLYGATEAVRFVFYLSRQDEGDYADCWMTDAVLIEPVAGKAA